MDALCGQLPQGGTSPSFHVNLLYEKQQMHKRITHLQPVTERYDKQHNLETMTFLVRNRTQSVITFQMSDNNLFKTC